MCEQGSQRPKENSQHPVEFVDGKASAMVLGEKQFNRIQRAFNNLSVTDMNGQRTDVCMRYLL